MHLTLLIPLFQLILDDVILLSGMDNFILGAGDESGEGSESWNGNFIRQPEKFFEAKCGGIIACAQPVTEDPWHHMLHIFGKCEITAIKISPGASGPQK